MSAIIEMDAGSWLEMEFKEFYVSPKLSNICHKYHNSMHNIRFCGCVQQQCLVLLFWRFCNHKNTNLFRKYNKLYMHYSIYQQT